MSSADDQITAPHIPDFDNPFRNRMRALRLRAAWWWETQSFPRIKRLIDVVVSLGAMLVLAPLLMGVALAIRLGDGGPALFWQVRVGRNGREFPFPKFRSMVVDAEMRRLAIEATNQHGSNGVTFKILRDPRVTRVGRFIRRSSIDELPQLWCVLRGDMTLVGPRPALVKEVARYSLIDRQRLSVKPGLTCTWQINGRSEIPFAQQCEMDIDYIRDSSLAKDVKLLVSTVPAVINGRGAY